MARILWLVALLSCIAATSAAQGLPPSQTESGQTPTAALPTLIPRSHEEREARYRAIHRVMLNVLAVDEFDRPVTGLSAQDFVLLDNGQPQPLATFRPVTEPQSIAPPHVVLILDALNNNSRSIGFEIKEIEKYLASSQGRLTYPTSIATLTTSGFNSSRPSIDASALLLESETLFKGIHPYECNSSSDETAGTFALAGHGNQSYGLSLEKVNDGNCLNERFALSVTALSNFAAAQKNVAGRVIVIWIGPGWPLLTGLEFHADTPEIRLNFFDHFVLLSRTLREAQVTVDAVSSPDLLRKAELQNVQLKPVAEGPNTEDQARASDFALQAVVTQSGGRITESASIGDQIARCVADLQAYYALSFDYLLSSKPDEYHSLKVKVDKAGVRVFTDTLYYAEP